MRAKDGTRIWPRARALIGVAPHAAAFARAGRAEREETLYFLGMRQALMLPLLLFALAPVAAAPASELAGRWYTEGVEHDLYAQVIEERRTDGSFTIEIRVMTACEVARGWKESGAWDEAGGALLKWTRSVAGRTVPDTDYYHDQFTVNAIDGDHMTVLDTKTRITWSLTRVPREFTFPPPAPCVNS